MSTGALKTAAVYICATRQHIGKSSVCMGAVSGLKRRFRNVGFMKPVGQRHEFVDGNRVDSDVCLIKECFGLTDHYRNMSPVVIHPSYTRDLYAGSDYLNRLAEEKSRNQEKIVNAFENIRKEKDFTVVEGTGHTGVGSVIGFSNAQVAAMLDIPMVVVANGGFGRTFDELHVAVEYARSAGADVRGVIINKVQPSKRDEVKDFLETSFLQQMGVENMGIIPYGDLLDSPTMKDFEDLFKTKLLAGENHRFQHYKDIQIVATGLRRFIEKLGSGLYDNAAFVTHASRADIVLGFISHSRVYEKRTGERFPGCLIVAGQDIGSAGGGNITKEFPHVMSAIRLADAPVLYVETTVYEVMKEINNNVSKLDAQDKKRNEAAIDLYESHINFDKLIR